MRFRLRTHQFSRLLPFQRGRMISEWNFVRFLCVICLIVAASKHSICYEEIIEDDETPGEMQVVEGSYFEIPCTVNPNGSDLLQVAWYKDGMFRYRITDRILSNSKSPVTSIFSIDEAKESDAGNYSCVINKETTVSTTIIQILPRPIEEKENFSNEASDNQTSTN